MSIRYLNDAFDMDVKPSSLKFVLVALADYANDEGEAYPSIETLVNKTSQNRKTVQANIKKLIALGLIEDTGKKRGKTKQIPVLKMLLKGAQKRERSQKRNSTENGIVKGPKNGTVPKTGQLAGIAHNQGTEGKGAQKRERSQKRDTEPSVINHQSEPSDMRDIFDFWKSVMGKTNNTRFTDERKNKIKARLKNYSPDEIRAAIQNCSQNKFNVENGYTDLVTICRSDDKLEFYRDMTPKNDCFDDDTSWYEELINEHA